MSEEFEEDIEMIDSEPESKPESMGGKRKSKRRVNPALGKWVAFVKKVQKEEKISYKEAMTRAKARKDKGEKWMGGGVLSERGLNTSQLSLSGGRRRRRTHKKRGSRKRRHTRRHMGGEIHILGR